EGGGVGRSGTATVTRGHDPGIRLYDYRFDAVIGGSKVCRHATVRSERGVQRSTEQEGLHREVSRVVNVICADNQQVAVRGQGGGPCEAKVAVHDITAVAERRIELAGAAEVSQNQGTVSVTSYIKDG